MVSAPATTIRGKSIDCNFDHRIMSVGPEAGLWRSDLRLIMAFSQPPLRRGSPRPHMIVIEPVLSAAYPAGKA